MAYCSEADLLLGGIPLPGYIDPVKQVADAADEIDSKIGYIYKTPIDVTDTSPVKRPARLLLKRINASLATGRLILAVASPEENKNLHAYGWNLVREATTALDAIASGQFPIEGADPSPDAPVEGLNSAPLISNLDAESNVEAFYDRISAPGYLYPSLPTYRSPDGFVR